MGEITEKKKRMLTDQLNKINIIHLLTFVNEYSEEEAVEDLYTYAKYGIEEYSSIEEIEHEALLALIDSNKDYKLLKDSIKLRQSFDRVKKENNEEKLKIYTKEFLDDLQERSKEINLISFIENQLDKSFFESVEILDNYLKNTHPKVVEKQEVLNKIYKELLQKFRNLNGIKDN